MDLQRSPPASRSLNQGPGSAFEITHDQVRLSQDTHLATLRLGRIFRGGKVAPYLGLRGRWTDLEIDDELGFRSPLGDETALRTHTRFESDSALAVAGLDARLGGPVRGRAEVTFGDGDGAVLLKMVYLLKPKPPPPPPDGTPDTIAEGIAGEFERLRRQLSSEATELEPLRATQPELYVSEVLELLARIETQAVAVLTLYDYPALADWLRDRFDEARAAIGAAPATRVDLRSVPALRPALRLASLRGPSPPPPGDDTDDGDEDEGWFARALHALSLVFIRARENCLSVRLRFDLESSRADVTVILYPESAPGNAQRRSPNQEVELKIGSYTYCIEQKGGSARPEGAAPCGARAEPSRLLFQCLGTERPPGPDADCPLDLAEQPVTRVQCRLADRTCTPGPRDRRCADARAGFHDLASFQPDGQ